MKPLELMEQGRFLGEEFILWLWLRAMTEGGTSGEEGDGSGLFVDDAIQLATERGEVKQISLAKGNPAECREAFEALSRGMRPVKVKIRILSGDLEWVGTLDSANLRLSALKMPPSTGKAPHERLHDRIFLLEEGHGHLDRRFQRFLAERVDDNGEALAQALLAWVRAGLEGVAIFAADVQQDGLHIAGSNLASGLTGRPSKEVLVDEASAIAKHSKALQVSEQLLATHKTVKNLHPNDWPAVLQPAMDAILAQHHDQGGSILAAGQKVAEDLLARGGNPMLVLAATVELIENPGAAKQLRGAS